LFGSTGARLSVESNLGNGSNFTLNLNAGASQVLRIAAAGSLRVGYVVVRIPYSASIRVTEVFRYEQNGVVLAELGVPQQTLFTHFTLPVEVDSSRGINTGVAFANPSVDQGIVPRSLQQTILVNLIRCYAAA
jgi:hypothetical protein